MNLLNIARNYYYIINMKIKKGKRLIAGLAFIGLTIAQSDVVAANCYDTSVYIKTEINSGNPSYPFPQFLEYKEGKTLAKYNAEGVTHADMEKTMREAYQIMSHRCRYEDTLCGVPYITFNNFRKHTDLEHGGAEFCTEGDGYMLLASAIFADQPTFNGLWMWIHDNRIPKATRYSDGKILFPDYEFSPGLASCYANGEIETNTTCGSATDGDEDIALALLIAYKQWGDTMMQNGKPVTDFNGNPISYRQMAKDYLSAFVDTFMYTSIMGDGTIYKGGHCSGDIGIDGYVKGGNKGKEASYWRNTQTTYPDISQISSISGGGGDGNTLTDYCAPAYYHEFAKWLEEEGEGTDWQINQYKRGEASSDWLIGEAYKQGLIPSIGQFYFDEDETKVIFKNFSEGEDFRAAWRTILNYLWHGNPETTWNPKTHQIDSVGNTFQYDMAVRYAEFMKRPQIDSKGNDCGKLGPSPDPNSLNWFGPTQIKMCYNMDGTTGPYFANYALGCTAPSVVALGDEELLGDIYRECELRWDAICFENDMTDDERNLNATAKYFHGWFRTLGMLVTSGNLAAPADMKPSANVKVYMSVDKTFAYKGDSVTYGVQLRNYGSADAKDAVVTTKLDSDYEFVSATKGGSYNAANHSITWNISNIPGFKTGELEATMDSVSFVVKVKNTEHNKVGLTSTVSGSNFENWESNAYPNNATYTMERNEVDILDNPLTLVKNLDTTDVSVNDTVECTIKIASNEVEWLNGGRDNVRLSYGNYLPQDNYNYNFYQFFRFWHDASEAYINMGNYRVSYYLKDTYGLASDSVSNGITCKFDNEFDAKKYGYVEEGKGMEFTIEDIPAGEDENGMWDKRIIMKFPNILSATTSHIENGLNSKSLIHKGVWATGFYRTLIQMNPRTIPENLLENAMTKIMADDWSFSDSVATKYLDGQYEKFTPITPGWYNEETLGDEITNYVRHTCDDDVTGFSRIVVEEWDGYTWRRIQGRGPVSGEKFNNLVLTDQLPKGLEFISQSDESGLSIKEENGKLSVEIPEYRTGKDIVLKYLCRVVENSGSNVIETGSASLVANNSTIESNAPKLTVLITDVNNVKVDQNELVDVYNANGALLRRQVEYKDALIGLQPGVYMVNGVKTIVK
ncbi:MAG: glycosyl hydrolase family 8 [Bacteroidales bacterium]|nr:glycosyl hydrolase family 8 [Bacteroidales bacterium]